MGNNNTNDIHIKCKSCEHYSKPKTISNVDSPCYGCLYNKCMVKTNNYKSTKVVKLR